MKYAYTAVFTKKDDKVYARVPDLAGCITTGEDLADAIEEMEDALSGGHKRRRNIVDGVF